MQSSDRYHIAMKMDEFEIQVSKWINITNTFLGKLQKINIYISFTRGLKYAKSYFREIIIQGLNIIQEYYLWVPRCHKKYKVHTCEQTSGQWLPLERAGREYRQEKGATQGTSTNMSNVLVDGTEVTHKYLLCFQSLNV